MLSSSLLVLELDGRSSAGPDRHPQLAPHRHPHAPCATPPEHFLAIVPAGSWRGRGWWMIGRDRLASPPGSSPSGSFPASCRALANCRARDAGGEHRDGGGQRDEAVQSGLGYRRQRREIVFPGQLPPRRPAPRRRRYGRSGVAVIRRLPRGSLIGVRFRSAAHRLKRIRHMSKGDWLHVDDAVRTLRTKSNGWCPPGRWLGGADFRHASPDCSTTR